MNTSSKKPLWRIKTTTQNSVNIYLRNFLVPLVIFFSSGLPNQIIAQQSKIDSLKKLIETQKEDTTYIKRLNELCNSYKNIYEYEIADSIAKITLTKAAKLNYSLGILHTNLLLGEIQYEINNYSNSLEIYNKLLNLSLSLKNKMYVAICYHRIASILEDRGKIEESYRYNLKSLEIRKIINDKAGISSSLGNIASYYIHKSDFNNALENLFEVLKINTELGNKKAIAYSYYNIAKVYFNIYNYTEALKFFNLCKPIVHSLNDQYAYLETLRSIGELYGRMNKFDEALDCFNEAMNIAIKNKNELAQSMCYIGIGNIFLKQNKLTNAFQRFQESLEIANKIGNKTVSTVSMLNIGEVYKKQKKITEAKKIFMQARPLVKQLGDFKEYNKELYKSFYEIDSIQGNWENALANYRLYIQYRDSLLKESNSKAKDSLRLSYEYENKAVIDRIKNENEKATIVENAKNEKKVIFLIIGVLILFVTLIFQNFHSRKKKEQAELQRQVAEHDIKALRAQMNPHFIFNCVHSIDRLLDDQKIRESKESLGKFSSLTRSVLENSERREITLAEELRILCLYMDLENTRFITPFTYSLNIDPVTDPEVTLIPPLILQPFVENAIKHGFEKTSRTGQIKIGIQKENDVLVCTVEDNGCGRNTGQAPQAISGFKKESMGIKLSEDRLKLLGEMKNTRSHFTIEDLTDNNNNPAGTRVSIFLPFEQSI